MKRLDHKYSIITAALAMLVLILDSKTALHAAVQGVNTCVYSVIPSLLPFFVFSIYMTQSLNGSSITPLRPIAKICGVPKGAESLLAVGLIGGYPVGASCIWEYYSRGILKKQDAHRLMGFCSNAGPAFIFGIMGSLFTNRAAVWLMWIIHMASALIVGAILPEKTYRNIQATTQQQVDFTNALRKSISAIAGVCGWVILFRMLHAYLSKWMLWLFPVTIQAIFTGVLELINGSFMLQKIDSEMLRFIIACGTLSFGGICVYMQTSSVTRQMGTGMYLQGKLMQALISMILSCFVSYPLFPGNIKIITQLLVSFLLLFVLQNILKSVIMKKTVAIAG